MSVFYISFQKAQMPTSRKQMGWYSLLLVSCFLLDRDCPLKLLFPWSWFLILIDIEFHSTTFAFNVRCFEAVKEQSEI